MRDYSGIVMNLRLLAADLETAYGEERGSSLYSKAADAIDDLLDMVDQMQEEAEDRDALIQFYEDCFEDILYAAKKAMRGSE